MFMRPAILLAAAGLLFFGGLRCALLEPDEARYAEIPRQMLADGRFLVPVLHGQTYLHKPPLLYWLVMASYQCFGVHDWAARLVPAGVGVLLVLATYAWGKQVVGQQRAFVGALILCLSFRFVYFGRMLTMDGLLALCVVTAWAGCHRALQGGQFRGIAWLLSALACGLGVLTKGPVALVLVIVPLLLWQVLQRRERRFPLLRWCTYLAVVCVVAGPWYIAVAMREPGGVGDFFWLHNVVRFLRPLDHREPVWFYLPGVFGGMLPWTLLLPALLYRLSRRRFAALIRPPNGAALFWMTAGWCLLFFSLAGCKRPGYVLPALPPLALMLGSYLASLLRLRSLQRTRRRAWAVCAATTFAVLLGMLYLALPTYSERFSLRGSVYKQCALVADLKTPVVCYPHRWDSVSFYLHRDDVRVYAEDARRQLIADLQTRANTLLFVKSGAPLHDLLRDLPPSLEFIPRDRHGIVTAGVIQRRESAAPMHYAHR